MSTPAAIAVYETSGPPPSHVHDRSWRGVYHHHEGAPEELGNELLIRLHMAHGDLARFVTETVTAAPDGWSSLGSPYTSESGEPPVTQDDTSRVAFVYALDVPARRLDVFATHVDGKGALVHSARIDEDGRTDPRFFDLTEDERRPDDVHADASPPATAEELERIVGSVFPIEAPRYEIFATNIRVDESEAMFVTFQVYEYREDKTVHEIAERESCIATFDDTRDASRIETFFAAWADAMRDALGRSTAAAYLVALFAFRRNPLHRTVTRDRTRLFHLVRASLDELTAL